MLIPDHGTDLSARDSDRIRQTQVETSIDRRQRCLRRNCSE
jgi:hypothetical protein